MTISLSINYLKIYLRRFFVVSICLSTLTGCFEHIQTFQRTPSTTPISNTLSSSGLSINSCRVTQVTIPGIPAENITINEADTSILVQYPETFGAQTFKVTYKLNPAACLIWKTDLEAEHSTCGGTWTSVKILFADRGVNYSSRTYKVKYKPVGQLAIGQGTEPILLTVGESKVATIQTLNYFTRPGYPGGLRATLTRLSDGKTLTPNLVCQPVSGGVTLPFKPLNMYLDPTFEDIGTYQLQIQTPDGAKITSVQPVIIRLTDKLIVTNSGYFYDYLPVPGQVHFISGYNLSEAYRAGADLIGDNGNRIQLPVIEYRNKGQQMVVRIPETTKNGHYVLQAIRDGIPTDQVSHFVVSDKSRPTFNQAFSQYNSYPLLAAPIRLGQMIYVRFQPMFGPSGYIKTKLKLVSKTNPPLLYLIDVNVVDERPYSGLYPPSVQFPTDWLPGDYTASLVQTQPDGTTVEGPAHLQTVRLTN